MSTTRNRLARGAVLAAAFAISFTVSKATDRQPGSAAVPVSIAPKAANPGVTGFGSPASVPRLLPQTKSEAAPSGTAPAPHVPETTPTQPPSGVVPSDPSPPAPPPPPSPRDPGPSGGGESQSGSL